MQKILITGAAGFIGFHLSKALLAEGKTVVGLDNLNSYYDVTLKEKRLEMLQGKNFTFVREDIANGEKVDALIKDGKFDRVVHLAAQAGVRYSLTNPEAYIESNLLGFFNVMEACKKRAVPHFVYASSSSVYGANTKLPFSEDDKVDTPVSLYAATKKSAELMAYSYSRMFGLPTTGFRFFTVYGPYGRPDMALFRFTKNMLEGKPIEVYNNGDMERDFTYVDDIVQGIQLLMEKSASLRPDSAPPYRIYNLGNNDPVQLMDFVRAIEEELGIKAQIEFKPMQPGDVARTYADTSHIQQDTGFAPATPLKTGVHRFVTWYREYYGV